MKADIDVNVNLGGGADTNGEGNSGNNKPKTDNVNAQVELSGDIKLNGNKKHPQLEADYDMKHRVLSGVGAVATDGYDMDNKAMTMVDWNKGVRAMHKKADFTEKLYEGVDMKKLGERQRRRKERKELALKYAGNPEVGFQALINQLKKEEAEDKAGFDMGHRIYSSMDVMRVNMRQNQDYKRRMKMEDKDEQIGHEMQTDIVHPTDIELQVKDVNLQTNTNLVVVTPTNRDGDFGLGDKPWHSYSPTEIMFELGTTAEGLTTSIHEERLKEFGLNQITPVPQMHPALKFLLHLVGGFQIFLWVGGILCMIAYGLNIEINDYQTLALGILCFVVVIGTAIFTQYQEGKSDDVMNALRALTPSEVYCLRDNTLQKVLAESLVPGDIVHVKAGEKVPADLRVLSSIDLKVNNASLTGENVDIKLNVEANSETLYEAKNIARMGCNFTCGNGVCIVFATGDNTFFGSIAKSTTEIKRPDSCLKKELKRFIISKI